MTAAEAKTAAGLGPYLERLSKPKRQANGSYMACCPFHDDRTPSLTVYPDGGFKCFGCDTHGDVLDFVQRFDSVEFAEAKQRIGGPAVPERAAKVMKNGITSSRIVATYPYTDEDGELLFEVCREDPKGFRQRRPNGDGWSWSLGDVRRPLYRLPQVLEASEVWLTEGEKDTEALEALGLVATTTPGGANAPWRDEWTDALTGRTVYVIPDNDDPGRKRGRAVMEALAGKAKAFLVELPSPHKDAADYLDAGNGLEDLLELARAAARPWIDRIASISSLEFKPLRFLQKPLIPEGALILTAGAQGSLKSFFGLGLAGAVATGSSFAGFDAGPERDVLYVDLENASNVIAGRRDFLEMPPAPRLRYWGRWADTPFPGLDAPELLDYASQAKPLIVFDSLIRFHTADENSNSEMAVVMGKLVALARTGATVLALHHRGKDKDRASRGAAEIEAAPDLVYRADRLDDGGLRLDQTKNRFDAERSFEFRLTRFGFQQASSQEYQ